MEIEEDTLKGRFLTFYVGAECYGIEIKYVLEIIGMQPIAELPELPDYIKGIINLRGKIIPVLDMRLRFKREPVPYTDRTCIIIIEIGEILVGLIVDSVAEVLTLAQENMIEPPQLNKNAAANIVKNIGKAGENVKLILDCEQLLKDEDITLLSDWQI